MDARNAGSAWTVAVLRWVAQRPRRLGQSHTEVEPVAEDLNTVVMIVEPPTQLW